MLRSSFFAAVVVGLISSANSPAAQSHPSDAIVGAWTLNKDKSDPPPADGDRPGRDDGRDRGDRGGRGGPGGPGGGFGGGGGRGGGFGGGRGGPGPGRGNEQEMQRRRDALRAILEPAERMTITRTDTMVIITTGDGHTTRLATDGSKVKDESTGFEQRTRWEGDRLVTEISGAARGKIVETYAPDPEDHELVVTIQLEGGANPRGQESGPSGTRKRVYELTQSR